jgi:Asp-tRNA(Asn)/Glu-tRNA(Gln) amidotransferase A subunit family amidase
VPVTVPDLELVRVAQSATVGAEATGSFRWALTNPRYFRQLGPDVRVTFAASRMFTAQDYIAAARIRRRAAAALDALFGTSVDVLVTPAAPCSAPAAHAAAAACGESNLSLTGKLMRFAQLANFLGLPAVSVPVGLDESGLPVGCAFDAYNHACLQQSTIAVSVQRLAADCAET